MNPQYLGDIELNEETLAHWGLGWVKKDHKYISRKRGKNGKWQYVYEKVKSKVRKITDKIDSDHDWIIDKFDQNISPMKGVKVTKIGNPESNTKRSEVKKTYKYFMKIKVGDGKYRYFYSKEEYDRYLKRIHALDKDYSFMQDVPVLPEKDDPNYAVKTTDVGSVKGNCSSCSIAFELRMRGYDVRSKEDVNGATNEEIMSNFKDAEYTIDDNWYLDTSRPENQGYSKYKSKGFFKIGYEDTVSESEKLQIAQNDLERTIKERGGDTQRGFITIGWTQGDADENGVRKKSGGGHVFNYVVKNGQVKYYDAQKGPKNNETGQEIDIKDYLDNTNYLYHDYSTTYNGYRTYMAIHRTDNKDLNDNVKDYKSYTPEEIHYEPEIERKRVYK